MYFEYFTYYIMAPFIFSIGLLGNICGIIVISKKNLEKIGPIHMYKYLFISDTVYLMFMPVNYFGYGFSYDLTIISKYICKLYWYLNYTIAPVSEWILSIINLLFF